MSEELTQNISKMKELHEQFLVQLQNKVFKEDEYVHNANKQEYESKFFFKQNFNKAKYRSFHGKKIEFSKLKCRYSYKTTMLPQDVLLQLMEEEPENFKDYTQIVKNFYNVLNSNGRQRGVNILKDGETLMLYESGHNQTLKSRHTQKDIFFKSEDTLTLCEDKNS